MPEHDSSNARGSAIKGAAKATGQRGTAKTSSSALARRAGAAKSAAKLPGFEAQRDALRPPAGKRDASEQGGLREAIEDAGSLLSFMRQVALEGDEDIGITRDRFAYLYNEQKNEDWLKDEFRAVKPNMHEWIPSNEIDVILSKARTTPGADDWIFLHNEMRTPTRHLIFKPEVSSERAPDGSLILRGHAGAVYLNGSPQTKDQPRFHDECRDVFLSSNDIATAVDGMRALVERWIWDGSPLPAPLHRGLADSMGVSFDAARLASEQAGRYADILAMFDRMKARHGS